MGSNSPEPQKLWVETPCIPSLPLSRAAGCNIFLKLENLQPSGSFKSRGIGSMMHRSFLDRCSSLPPPTTTTSHPQEPVIAHFYCSSGGNAGLACATAAATLGQPCTIVVPTLVSPFMIDKLRALGAEVVQVGANWALADAHLREELLARDSERGVYVPPFDHPHVWAGASSMVDEMVVQVGRLGRRDPRTGQLLEGEERPKVDAVVCSVGGGGLLNGIMEGIERHVKDSTDTAHRKATPRVLAVETVGAESLDASIQAGKLVTLPAITSIATSLGAPTVSARTFQWAQQAPHLCNLVVSDADAVMGCVRLADDARVLVEVACGAAVCPVYNGDLRRCLGGEEVSDEEWSRKNVVIVVCGGSNISLDILRGYKEKYHVQ
ncbi:tryptophan synthase beta subunit-like PLP-dependent enzyme [Microdochium bolleyi]|uniref:L-serine ammonia-lyase n=1 Tax=Microdochium bolleyi TaxID=196109 RepID=A0A136J831_9PEZI|nr:tryptophan synthase beta subunit-like PLP-dependent enzyme [Microdochium bolleyi]